MASRVRARGKAASSRTQSKALARGVSLGGYALVTGSKSESTIGKRPALNTAN